MNGMHKIKRKYNIIEASSLFIKSKKNRLSISHHQHRCIQISIGYYNELIHVSSTIQLKQCYRKHELMIGVYWCMR